jgi:cytoskeletal protein CcmA (bactofilin family)
VAKINDMNTNCVIGEGSVFEGKFYVNGPVLIEGKFQGDIRTDDQVVIGPTGKVKTDISARKVTVSGTIIGNITAAEEVNLLATGKVLGNISTPKLNVEQGVVTSGQVIIHSSNNNNVDKIITDSFGEEAETLFREAEKKPYPKDKKTQTADDKTQE